MIRTSFSPWCVRLSVLLGITAWTAIAAAAQRAAVDFTAGFAAYRVEFHR